MAELERHLDTKRLHYFYHVARFQSFRQAARHLRIAQPALSRHIQLLETELGVVLFQRGGHISKLTEAGQLLFDRASQILSLLTDTRNAIEEMRLRPKGVVTLAVPASFTMAFLPQLLSAFTSSLPEIHLRILEGAAPQIEDWLLRGQANVGVTPMPSASNNLIQEHLLTDELFLVGNRRPGWIKQGPVSFAALRNLPLILPTPPNTSRRLVDEVGTRSGGPLTPLLEIDGLHTIKQLLLTSDLYSVMPGTALRHEIEAETLFIVPISPTLKRRLAITTVRGEPLSHAARALAQEIRRVIRDQARGGPQDG